MWTIKDPFSEIFGKTITLITESQLNELPDGTVLYNIFGLKKIKGVDYIDTDTRGPGYLSVGILEE